MESEQTLKQQTARLSILSNTALIIMKIIVGVVSGSVSILSEAMHSGVDLLAALIAFFAVRQAGKPPDKDHAYGHGKLENLSGAIEALLIIGAAVGIIYEAAEKLLHPQPVGWVGYGVLVMGVSSIVNWLVSRRLMAVAKLTRSQALEADALHLRTDIWTSAGVMVGLAAMFFTGYHWLDPLFAILVAGMIFQAGFEMTKKSVYELIDVSLPEEEEDRIQEIVLSHPEVLGLHKLRTRSSGSFRQIDMHILLNGDMPLRQAHAISDQLEAEIEERLGQCNVVIHLEPSAE